MDKQIKNYLKILETTPGNVPAFKALDKIFTEQENWEELAKLYETRAGAVASQAEKLYLQAAEVYRSKLQNTEDMERVLLQLLEVKPGNPKAIEQLQGYWEETGQHRKLKRLVKEYYENEDDPEVRVTYALKLAELESREGGDSDERERYLTAAIADMPEHTGALDALRTLHLERHEFDTALEVLERQIATYAEPQEAFEAIFATADALSDDPFEIERTRELLERAAELAPSKKKRGTATKRIKELDSQAQEWEAVVPLWLEQARDMAEKTEASRLYFKVAAMLYLYNRDDHEGIIDALQKALLLNSANARALSLSERFLQELGDVDRLTEFYESIFERTRDERMKSYCLTKAASYYKDKGDTEKAQQMFEEAYELDPTKNEAFEAVCKILVEKELWVELSKQYERRIELAPDPAFKVRNLLSLADLMATRLESPFTARDYYEEALDLDDACVEAARALMVYYKEDQEDLNLAKVTAVIAAHDPDPEQRAENGLALTELRLLLDQYDEAFEAAKAAEALKPGVEEYLKALENAASQIDAFEDVIEIYRRQSEDLCDEGPEECYRLLMHSARILDRELSQYEKAETLYLRLLEMNSNDIVVLRALGKLHLKDEQWEKLVDVYGRMMEVSDDDDERRSVMMERGQILEMELGRNEEAAETFARVVERFPEEIEAYKSMERLYRDLEQWEKLATTIEAELGILTSMPERINLYYQLGDLYEHKLSNIDGAITAYSEVLKLDENHIPSIEALERLLEQGSQANVIFTALEPYYLSKQEYDKLSQGYRSLLDDAETPEERATLYRKLANLHDEYLDERETAFRWLEQALVANPLETDILPQMRRLARELERSERLVQMLQERQESLEDDTVKAHYALTLAQINMEELNNPDAAEASLVEAAQYSPDDPTVLRTVVEFYLFAESWPHYSVFASRLLPLLEDETEAATLSLEVAEVNYSKLERIDDAIAVLEQLLEKQPGHEQCRARLRVLYREAEQWDKLVAHLYEELNLSKSDEAIIDAKLELGEIHEQVMEQRDTAADLYGDILLLNSKVEKAVAGLERLMEQEDSRHKAAGYLVPVYDRHKQHQELARALAVLFETSPEDDKKREYAERLSSLYIVELSDKQQAFNWALQAYIYTSGVDPSSNVETLAVETGDWEGYLEALETKKQQVSDDILRIETLLLKQAMIAREELAEPERALQYLQERLEADDVNLPVIEAAERLYENMGMWEELYALWERKLDKLEERVAKRELSLRMADLKRSILDDPDTARRILATLLAERDNDFEVIDQLAAVLSEMERWDDLLELFKHKLNLLREEDEIVPLRIAIGELYEQKLDNLDEAMKIYLQVIRNNYERENVQVLIDRLLEKDATQLEVANEIEMKLTKTKEWLKLVSVHEIQLRHQEDPNEKRKLLSKLSAIYQEKLKDPVKAFEGFTRVFIEDPHNEEALFELEKLASELGYWKELADVYERGSDALGDDHENARALLLKAAQLYEEILAQQDDAIRAYRKVLNHDPVNLTAIRALEVLCRKAELWPELVDIYLQRIELADDDAEKRDLLWSICELYENPDQLNERLAALPYYEMLLDLDDTDGQVQLTLLQLYAETENWEKTASVLQRQVEQAMDDESKVDTMLKLAMLYEDRLDQPVNAIAWFRSIIEAKSDHEQAFAALELYLEQPEYQQDLAPFMAPLYKKAEQWPKYIDSLEYQIQFTEGRESKADLLLTIADTYENRLDDGTMAYVAYTRAFREVAGHEYIQNQLERLASELGRFEELVALYEEELSRVQASDDENQRALIIPLSLQAARLYEEHLQNLDSATEKLQIVLGIEPRHREALTKLERIYSVKQQWSELIEILRLKLEIADGLEEKKTVYFRICNIYEDEIGDNPTAIDVYREMLDLDERDRDVLHALARLCRSEAMWDDLIGVLEHELLILEDETEKRHVYTQMAQVKWQQLSQGEEALRILGDVVNADPEHFEARELLEQMLNDEAVELGASRILEPLFDLEEAWERLIQMLQIQERHATGADDKRSLNERIANIFEEKLGNASASFPYWCSAITAHPMDEGLAEHLSRLAIDLDQWPQLVEHYTLMLDELGEDENALYTYRVRIGDIHLQRLDSPGEAEPFYRNALDQRPEEYNLLDTLQTIYEELERWPEMVQMLFRKAELSALLTDKLSLLFLAANIQEANIQDIPAAIATYNMVLQSDADNMNALIELDRLYTDTESWQELEGTLEHLARLTKDSEIRVELLFRRAELWQHQLENVPRSIELYAEIINENRDYEPAFDNVTALVSDTEYQEQSLAVLQPVYQEMDRWDKIADLLERKLATVEDHDLQVSLLTEIKEIHELRLEDEEAAFATARRLYMADYEDPIVAAELERLAVATGGYEGLVETYLEIVELVEQPETKIEIYTQVAEVCEVHLADYQKAIVQLRNIMALDPENIDAAEKLDTLYEQEEMWVELVELIPQKIRLLDNKKEIFEQKLRVASLWETKLEDNETAISIYEEILSEKPDNTDALHSLQRLYEAEERWDQLVQVLRAEVRIARGDTNKARLYARMGDVLFDKLERTKEALNLYNRVLQFDESNTEVIEKMEHLFEGMELWDQLVVHIQKQLRRARKPEDKVRYNKKLAFVYRTHLNLEDKAVNLYHKVLELDPSDMEAVGMLEDIYINNKAWQKLADLLKLLLTRVEPEKQKQINLRLASLYFQHVEDPNRAMDYARKVLDADPNVEELGKLEEIFRDSEYHEIYREIITRQIAITEDPQQKIFLLFRLADLAMDHGEKDEAINAYERVLEIEPTHLLATEALEPLYLESENWQKLVGAYRVMLGEYTEGRERLEVLEKMGRTYEEKLSDAGNAFEAYSIILRENPERYELIQHTEELARQASELHQLVRLYREVYSEIPDKSQQRLLCAKIAQLYHQELNNLDLAAEYFKMYLEFGEYDETAVEFLISYHREHEEWDELVLGLEYKLPHVSSDEKIAIYHDIGGIYAEKLDDVDEAIKTYRSAYQIDDTNLITLDRLVELLDRKENWEGLAEMLRQKLHVVTDADQQMELRLAIARLFETKLNDIKNAKVYYRAVIADNPTHRECLDALERIYEIEENYDEMLEVLTRKVPVAVDDEEKIAIYVKTARIWERHFEQIEMAITYYEKVLVIDEGNISAILELERIYKSIGHWSQLVETYKQHIAQIAEIDEIVMLYCNIGRICSEYLFNPGEAINYLNKALTIDPENIEVLETLSNLYLSNEKWSLAIEILDKLRGITEDKDSRTQYIIKISEIYKDQLEDEEAALAKLRELFEEDTSYVPGIRALRRFYQDTKRWDDFLGMVEHEKDHITDPSDMAQLLFEESLFFRRERKDDAKAIELLKKALEQKADFSDAIKELAALTYAGGMFEEAWDYLTRSLGMYDEENEDDNIELAKIHFQLGAVAEKLDKEEMALNHYSESYRRNADSLRTLEALANVLYRREDWEQAFRVYQTILVRFRDRKSTEELVGLFCRLGEINGKMGKHDVAVRMYEKALEVDPNSVTALTASVHYYESLERWAKVIKYRVSLSRLVEKEGAFDQWLAIGDIYHDRLNQTREALEAFKRALQIKSDDVLLLSKVAAILVEQEKWKDAIGAYRRILSLEKSRENKVSMTLKLAELIREHGDDPNLCIDFYNAALDLDPANREAFTTLETFLENRDMWEQMDNALRLQINRLPEEAVDEKVGLWRKLADILVNKSDNLEDGIKAYEVIVAMQPSNNDNKIDLANLYCRDPQFYDKAAMIHESILREEPLNARSHQALFELKFNLEKFDRAFMHTAVLKVMGDGDDKANTFYDEHSRESRTEALDFIDRNEWYSFVSHADGQSVAGQIFTMLYHHVDNIVPSDLKSLGLRKRDRLELSESINFCTTTNYVLRTLGATTPEVYLKQGIGEEIIIAPIYPATLLIPANAFENYSQRDLLFHIGRAATLARPDFVLGTMYTPKDLLEFLEATITLYVNNYPITADEERLAGLRKMIDKSMPRKMKPQLEQYVTEFLKHRNSFDFNAWYTSLFLTANRAATIICNDLATATKWVEKYAEGESAAWIEAQKYDLLTYWTSEQYAYIRRKLGFSIV